MTADSQFYTIVSMFGTFMGGAIWFAIRTSKEIGALKVTAVNNHERIEQTTNAMREQNKAHRDELLKEIKERGDIAKNLQETNNWIFQKLDDIVKTTSDIQVSCGRHDQRLQNLEKIELNQKHTER